MPTPDDLREAEHAYPSALHALVRISGALLQIAEQVDVATMRSICERFEALAPIITPSSYIQGGDLNLRDQAAFLQAVDEFVTALRKLEPTEPHARHH